MRGVVRAGALAWLLVAGEPAMGATDDHPLHQNRAPISNERNRQDRRSCIPCMDTSSTGACPESSWSTTAKEPREEKLSSLIRASTWECSFSAPPTREFGLCWMSSQRRT